ncbi:MAG: ATP-binding cassette domain-containing protein [Gammaproteobacteria bacterium]|nr:ATP-binding cassette domain-containing protein [Gammaproteobacteria bacterium]MBL6999037.1 ATP-binding cassette domain-containing protein [Gammaproteobacteria bacterium]
MLKLEKLSLRRGALLLFEDVTLSITAGNKLGLTGANGCGKSSLLSLILGELHPDEGDFYLSPEWVVAHVAQQSEASNRAAIEVVMDGDHELRALQQRLLKAEQAADGDEISACHIRLEEIDGYQAYSRAARLLTGLSFSEADMQRPMSDFSGGWRMRLNLASALMCRSELLLLDEPTNHLDLDAVIWLEQWLKRYPGTLIMISHDRDFLDSVVTSIAHVEQQHIQLYRGNYSAFERLRAERLGQQQSSFEKQQKTIKHMQSFVDRFKAKASKAKQAQSRVKALERMALIAPAHVDSPFNFEFAEPDVLPSFLMRIDEVSAGYAEVRILDKVNLTLLPGERIGLLGLNGAGKSTLIKLIAGEIEPQKGVIERAKDLKVGYFAQHQLEQLDSNASALLHLQRIDSKAQEKLMRSFLGGFNFQGDKVLEPVGPFSGGEKARLVLALLIWQKPNLLLLDEPTNHLDLEMRLALNNALQEFAGSVILVSHDRHLLRTVCDDLLLVDSGKVQTFQQEVDDYPRWLAERRGQKDEPAGLNKTPVLDRKEQKKREAEFRKTIQPQISRQTRLERAIEKIEQKQTEAEAQLADSTTYDDANKERLQQLLFSQADNKRQLEDLEMEWFEISEQIEQLRSDFEQLSA